ncbi:hypothetical protein P2318_28570 [Myxococcaceae bacterium GXIMD 01537]
MASSRRRAASLWAVLLSATAAAQAPSSSETPPPPRAERRELPPAQRQRLATALQRLLERRPAYLVAVEQERAAAAKLRELEARQKTLETELQALLAEGEAIYKSVMAEKDTNTHFAVRSKELVRLSQAGPLSQAQREEVERIRRFDASLRERIARREAIGKRILPMSEELKQLIVDLSTQELALTQSRVRTLGAALAMRGADPRDFEEQRP